MLRAVSGVPVIVATARDDEQEIIRTLNAGADEYVVKPYSVGQLDARIRAVLRRVKGDDVDAPVRIGGLSIDTRSRVATVDGASMDLSRKEFDLLRHLASFVHRLAFPSREDTGTYVATGHAALEWVGLMCPSLSVVI